MRIVICGANDLAGVISLNALASIFRNHDVTMLLWDLAVPKSIDSPLLHEFHYFMSELPARFLFPLIEKRTTPSDGTCWTPAELAKIYGAKLHFVDRSALAALTDELLALKPDVMLSVRFGHIFKEPLLSLPRCGIYNIHSGVLPSYGGILTPFRAMLNGESVVGATLHQIDAGIDTGPIVGVKTFKIQPHKSLLWHYTHLYALCVEMFEATLDSLERSEPVTTRPQALVDRCYYRFPSNEEIAEFVNLGFRFVRFDDYVEVLGRFTGREDASALVRDHMGRVANR